MVGKTSFDLKFVLQKQMMHQEAGSVLIVVMIGLLMTSSRDCGFGFDYFHVVTVAKTNLESQRLKYISSFFLRHLKRTFR